MLGIKRIQMSSDKHDKVQQISSISKLIEALGSSNLDDMLDASNGLRQIGESALPELTKALETSTARHRIAAILGQLGDTRAVLPLIALLSTDSYDQARYSAALALGELGDKRATESLILALDDPDSAVRNAAASALGDLRDESAIPYLIRALEDSDWELRRQSAYSLGKIGSSQALEPLIATLQDEYSEVREWAVLGLGRLGMEEALENLLKVQEHDKGQTFEGHNVSEAATKAIAAIKGKAPDLEP